MRIVHVTDCYLPRVGGIELHVHDLATRQRAAGHHVTVVTTTPGVADPGVRRVAHLDQEWRGGLAPDVLHAHVSIVSPFAFGAARRGSMAGVPTVVTVHSMWTHVGPLPELARDVWRMQRWPLVWSAVSNEAARPVRRLLDVPVEIVPNAVDLDDWSPQPAPPAPAPLHVLSVMRLTSVKRAMPLVGMLRDAARAADFEATVIGDGPRRGEMERFLRRHDLLDRIHLVGRLDRTAIREQLARASIFVAPSHRESFGIAALEARTSGVPVLASARSGVASFIEHGRDGLLADTDREMAEHLVTLLTDDDLRERVRRHNREVRPPFGWSVALARNEALYAVAGATRQTEGVLAG